jgi:pyridoxamine 5'-phosphate oxidase-like protein
VTDVQRRREELSPPESMRLLGGVSLGRVVFTERALPAIRPVSHLVDGDYIVIRTDSSAAIISGRWSGPGSVVAYEADAIGPADHLGWSVIVVGVARWVTDPEKAAAYRQALRPWVTGSEDQVIAIHADIVTGFRLVSTTSAVIRPGQSSRPGRAFAPAAAAAPAAE